MKISNDLLLAHCPPLLDIGHKGLQAFGRSLLSITYFKYLKSQGGLRWVRLAPCHPPFRMKLISIEPMPVRSSASNLEQVTLNADDTEMSPMQWDCMIIHVPRERRERCPGPSLGHAAKR